MASTLPEVSMLVDLALQHDSKGPFCDVLYGVPISASKLIALAALRNKIPKKGVIHILMDHPSQIEFVQDFVAEKEASSFSVFVKLDTGYHRAGITCDDRGVDLAMRIIRSPHLDLTGVYSHW